MDTPQENSQQSTVDTEKPFDSKAFMAARNAGKPFEPAKPKPAEPEKPAEPAKPEPAKPEPAKPTEEEEEHAAPRLSRSQRREHSRLLRELGEASGRAKAMEEMLAKLQNGKQEESKSDDPEPKQDDFKDWGEFTKAQASWSARQENRKADESRQQSEAFREQMRAAATKAADDRKQFEDWDATAKAAEDEGPEWTPAEHPQLMGMLATSDVQAYVLYHFAKNPEALEQMLALSAKPHEQIRAFHRLEGRLEKLYEKPAAPAAKEETPSEDRTKAEKPAQGGSAVDRDVHKPRPSSEVTARGGSAAPEEPPIGSGAWMVRRNQAQFGR